MTAHALERLPIDQLRPWPRNVRTHSRKQVRQIAESIRRFGFTNPVLIDGENRILAGHGRVKAARELGMATAPCLRIDHMSATEKRAYVLADNKLALNAGWDEELLALERRPDGGRCRFRRRYHRLLDRRGRSVDRRPYAFGAGRSGG
jgi:ParB-like chromosome segregation protein Spo0J